GAKVTAVVPQPISRVGGVLSQAGNQIVVHFNEDDLDPNSASDPRYYQLHNVTDGTLLLPQTVVYDSSTNTATLTFGTSDLPDATYHLRVGGSREAFGGPEQ